MGSPSEVSCSTISRSTSAKRMIPLVFAWGKGGRRFQMTEQERIQNPKDRYPTSVRGFRDKAIDRTTVPYHSVFQPQPLRHPPAASHLRPPSPYFGSRQPCPRQSPLWANSFFDQRSLHISTRRLSWHHSGHIKSHHVILDPRRPVTSDRDPNIDGCINRRV